MVKLGYIWCLNAKSEIPRLTEFFQEQIENVLGAKVQLTLFVSNTNDGIGFKGNTKSLSREHKKNKVEY